MQFDTWTLALASAIVVVVSSTMYIIGTLAYKDNDTGRIWSVAYMSGMLTTLSFLVFSLSADAWWAGGVGNTAMVVGSGLFWGGCRVRNGRRPLYPVIATAGVAAALAAWLQGPAGGAWAGAEVYFAGVAVFAAAAALELARGRQHQEIGSVTLTVIFSVQSAFYLLRLIGLTVFGADSEFFLESVGSNTTAIVTMILIPVLATTMSNMRAERARSGTAIFHDYGQTGYTEQKVLRADSFEIVVEDWLERCQHHGESLALLHLNLDNLSEINTAFGRAQGDLVLGHYISFVRRFGPPHSDIGQAGPGRLVMATPIADAEDARAAAAALQTILLEAPITQLAGLRPTLSVGVALSGPCGYDFQRMNCAAREACDEASSAGGNRVVVSSVGYPVTADQRSAENSRPEVSR
ncbi:MAG: diguanylate cyclase [Microbacteriaceae bacterium]